MLCVSVTDVDGTGSTWLSINNGRIAAPWSSRKCGRDLRILPRSDARMAAPSARRVVTRTSDYRGLASLQQPKLAVTWAFFSQGCTSRCCLRRGWLSQKCHNWRQTTAAVNRWDLPGARRGWLRWAYDCISYWARARATSPRWRTGRDTISRAERNRTSVCRNVTSGCSQMLRRSGCRISLRDWWSGAVRRCHADVPRTARGRPPARFRLGAPTAATPGTAVATMASSSEHSDPASMTSPGTPAAGSWQHWAELGAC